MEPLSFQPSTDSSSVIFHRGESTGADWESTLADHWEIPAQGVLPDLSRLLLVGYTLKLFPGPITARVTSDPLSIQSPRFGRLGSWAVRVSYPHVARVLPSSTARPLEPVSIRVNSMRTRGGWVVHDPFISASPRSFILDVILQVHLPSPLSPSFLQRQISLLPGPKLRNHRLCIRDIIHHS